MEVNRSARRTFGLVVLALVFACVSVSLVGMLVGDVASNINEKSCGVIGAGINELAPTQSEMPQTEEACLELVRAAKPFYTFWGIMFVGTLIFAVILIAGTVGLILSRKSL